MKKILKYTSLVLILFLCVILFNTLTLKSDKFLVEEVDKVEVPDGAIDRFTGALKFKTISSGNTKENYDDEFYKLHDYLETSFPLVYSSLKKQTFNQSLLFKWEGENEELNPIMLMSHLDVVPVDQTTLNDWEAPPFSGIVKDGIIFGRGTLDDKVSVLGILEAVENLINNGFNPKRTIYLAFGHDEEIGGNNGAGVISNYLEKKGVELEFVLDEGGFISEGLIPGVDKPVAMINVAEKGYVSYELTIKTKGGHSSQPPKNNTIGSLAKAITKLESNQFKLKMTPLIKTQINILGAEMSFLGKMFFANSWLFKNFLLEGFNAKTSIAPTIISGGIKDNVIPTTASVIVNFRIMTGDDSNKIKQHIIKTIDDERISVNEINPANLPSPVSDYNSDSFKLIQKTIAQIFPKVIVTPGLIGGGTDTKHYEKISKNAYRFYPMRANSENMSGVHGINERISISNYKEIVQFVYQFLINQNNNDNE